MTGERNYRWKGGRISDDRGYICIYKPDHPHKINGSYVLEHRLVAEEVLGRYLKETEVVHHVNGVKHDNRKENLVICQDGSYHQLIHNKMRKLGISF
jgi:hypothetical protein